MWCAVRLIATPQTFGKCISCSLHQPQVSMICPLCCSSLKKHLVSPTQALISCPNEACVYPFNMSMDEIWNEGLNVRTSEQEIMAQMGEKLLAADVDPRTASFMSSVEKEENINQEAE